MKYIMIPSSFNEDEINKRFSNNEFLDLQTMYREKIEKELSRVIDFKELDKKIEKIISIPILDDRDYNFYHEYSSLDSKYIYLRNNYHIENLVDEEIKQLKSNNCNADFLKNTIPRVMFENGDLAFFGNDIPKYLAKSKSLVFEFAYDQKKLVSIEELNTIEKLIKEINDYIKVRVETNLNIETSFITYDGIYDIYKSQEQVDMKHLI